nr:putative zinc finger, CCHC-type, retrotransposon Gag domain protein [Tanacetum cinerariifolium]
MSPKTAPLTQAAIRRMIKENVDAALAVVECTFIGFMKCNLTIFHGTEGVVKLRRWSEKTESIFKISECAEGKKVKFAAATLQGPSLTWWNAKQGNARAMVTAPTDKKAPFGSLPLYEHYFTHHVGPCIIKCHKCGKVGHKEKYCKEKNVDTGSDGSFMDTIFSSMLNIDLVKIRASYEVELADGRVVSRNTVLK